MNHNIVVHVIFQDFVPGNGALSNAAQVVRYKRGVPRLDSTIRVDAQFRFAGLGAGIILPALRWTFVPTN